MSPSTTLPFSSDKISGPLSPLSAMAYVAGHGRGAPRAQRHQQHSPLNVGYTMAVGGLYDQMLNIGEKKDDDEQESQQLQSQRHSYTVDEEDVSLEVQNADLRAQIFILESDAEAEQRALDDMLTELTSAQEELYNAEARLAAKESECADLQARLAQSGDSGKNGTTLPVGGGHAQPELHGSTAEMQRQIDDLLDTLRSKDMLLSKQEAELATTCEKLAATQTQAQQSVASSQDNALISEHRRTVEKLKEEVRFFKANSEQLGQEIRELKDENLRLVEDLEVKQRELDDERSLNVAIMIQVATIPAGPE
ncbi:hypothetical protein CMQ_2898 [Grosmannia clavigera kw1407]|uniref:Uncharacterized protein n=1 Tax=Grosmannia clavigera (strain kw1407 / UAMH 11150) TaxID=655863 RepID=F0XIA0_GROCL|nr:uncharacterized protein CMQ_2898 [Grosmannia clavigera kw1407]EFX02969.1 hypothetical protein CMQ_2898 [Grosmannia clavigera kw1407]